MEKTRLLALLLALAMFFVLSACSSSQSAAPAAEEPAASAAEEPAAEEPAAEEPAAEPVDDTVYEMKLSSSQVTGSWLADLFDEYAVMVDEATNGRVKITVYHDNALGAPSDLYTMLTQGGLEILNLGIAQAGEFPVTDIVQTPFLLSTPDTAGEIMWTLLEEDKLPEFTDNMHVLAFLPTDMQMFVTVDDKIETIDDFSGMKIRANSGQLISAIEALNATAVSITTTEVFLSLSQGVIDGAISSPSAMAAFAWQDVCKYLYALPICTGMNYIGVNLDVWNSLPADLQEAMDQVSREFYDLYMVENNAAQQISIDNMVAAGVEYVELSDETVAAIKEATSTMLDDLAESLNDQGIDGTGLIAEAREIVANSQFEK